MLSNGCFNATPLGKYTVNGGGFVGEISGEVTVSTTTAGRSIVRRFAAAVATVKLSGRLLTPLASTVKVATTVSGKLTVRRLAAGRAIAAVRATGAGLRRPIATAVLTVAFSHLGKAGYLYFRPTDRRRISTITESRLTHVQAEYRTTPIHREERAIFVPREAGK